MDLNSFREQVTGTLIVSAQAPDGHPLRDTTTIAHLAAAAVAGGATAIRCGGYGGLEDIRAVVEKVSVPVIGLTKEGSTGVYITPTVASARKVAQAGAAVVAVDATFRPCADGSTFAEKVEAVHGEGALIMADIATVEEAIAAHRDGADIISTTLAGYTEHREKTPGPDLELVSEIRKALGPDVFLTAEGRYHTPELAAEGLARGADAVIIGTAITDVSFVTAQFARKVEEAGK
ncbi:putative N-acetylmannosamine-6-phosphate 2-epimerase [Corynebacterium freiburgense]|uniref:putative N-acetylmannosamine-6-phosphate 2-epimerase n=1 Tax=Corynebacterium freiburgense TaxID=556548 RepID=UPI000405A110|nr:putative N-acetylmannosamine-6-phosphate 2-epimerase [Corynebacterium freiburgense]WJZ02969.1 Putative N-acetylmannosamine-6-phosphate 2-epimerase [Corynebacterium freiburgense]